MWWRFCLRGSPGWMCWLGPAHQLFVPKYACSMQGWARPRGHVRPCRAGAASSGGHGRRYGEAPVGMTSWCGCYLCRHRAAPVLCRVVPLPRGAAATMCYAALLLPVPCYAVVVLRPCCACICRSFSLHAISIRHFHGEQHPPAVKIHELHYTIPKLVVQP